MPQARCSKGAFFVFQIVFKYITKLFFRDLERLVDN
jgi:hypothetical protein